MYRNFTYKGRRSTDFGILIKEVQTKLGGYDIETQIVPGKSGESITDTLIKNNEITYTCNFQGNRVQENFSRILNWLNGDVRYEKLQDSYIYNRFRNGYVKLVEVEKLTLTYCVFSVTFSCEPYLYHMFGANGVAFKDSVKLHNIYGTTAEPIICVKGMGTIELNINGNNMTLRNVDNKMTIDSVNKQVHSGTTLKNSFYKYNAKEQFPILINGENTITVIGGSVSSVSVIPNWRGLG